MTKLWLLVAVALGTCCVGALLLTAGGLQAGSRVAASARQWLDRELPPILEEWDLKRFERLTAPELRSRSGADAFRKTFEAADRRFGKLTRYEGSKIVGYDARATTEEGTTIVVSLRAQAQFEKGAASILARAIRVEEGWRLASFEISDVPERR